MLDAAGSGNIATGATSAQVMPNRNGRRISFSITNYGSNIAWVNLANYQIAAVGQGIPVYPGTPITDSSSDKYECWQGSISCIQDTAGTTNLAFWERVKG